MKVVPKAITFAVARSALISKKSSPAVLFGAGIIGVGTTVVLACKATLKVDDILEQAQKDIANVNYATSITKPEKYTEKDQHKDIVYIRIRTAAALCKLYAPAAIVGVASVGALAGAQHILSTRNAALTAAYGAVQKTLNDYRERVRDEYGEERERELYYDAKTVEIVDEKTGKKKTVKRVGPKGASMYARFFGPNSASFCNTPEYNWVFLRGQQNYMNDILQSRGHLFLNEVYDALGIERSKEGAVVGWVRDNGDSYVDFGIFDRDVDDRVVAFMSGDEAEILLDFNVDGIIYDKI